jgi:hypothetical protein
VVVIVPMLFVETKALLPDAGVMSKSANVTPPVLLARLTPAPLVLLMEVLPNVTSVVEF